MELYLYLNEQQTGPFTDAQARTLVFNGEIGRGCLAWREGMPDWLPLEQVIAFPPPRPGRSACPEGLPALPVRPVKATGVKDWSDQLEKRLAATKFGPLIERHGRLIGRVVSGIALMAFIVKCRHGR